MIRLDNALWNLETFANRSCELVWSCSFVTVNLISSSLISINTAPASKLPSARKEGCSIPLQANFTTLAKTECADNASEDHPSGAQPVPSPVPNQKRVRFTFVVILRVPCHRIRNDADESKTKSLSKLANRIENCARKRLCPVWKYFRDEENTHGIYYWR